MDKSIPSGVHFGQKMSSLQTRVKRDEWGQTMIKWSKISLNRAKGYHMMPNRRKEVKREQTVVVLGKTGYHGVKRDKTG